MRWGTISMFGHRIKGQGKIGHFVYESLWAPQKLQLLPDHFQNMLICSWDEDPIDFVSQNQKSTLALLNMGACGHDTGSILARSLSNFT